MDIPTELSNPDHHADGEQQGNLLLEYERKFEQLSNDKKLSKLCLDAGLKSVELGQFFITLDVEEGPDEMKTSCREKTRPRKEKGTVAGGWIVGGTKIGPGSTSILRNSFSVSKAMIRLLRHGQSAHREEDGAVRVRFDDILKEFKKKFDGALQWSIGDWTSTLKKKRFQYCLNPNSSQHFLYFRAIQGHSGGDAFDPELQDNVLISEDFTKKTYHAGNVCDMYSKIRNEWIA